MFVITNKILCKLYVNFLYQEIFAVTRRIEHVCSSVFFYKPINLTVSYRKVWRRGPAEDMIDFPLFSFRSSLLWSADCIKTSNKYIFYRNATRITQKAGETQAFTYIFIIIIIIPLFNSFFNI